MYRNLLFGWIYRVAIVSTTLVGVYGQTPVFIVHPVSTAAIDGTTVEFTCTAENANIALEYIVNNTAATQEGIINKGFMMSPNTEQLGGNTLRRNLTVTVSSALNNNSEIHCLALSLGGNVNSSTATLTVQGPLSAVGDLSYTYIDFSTINISWSPPFTLPGTYITGYNISVTSNGTITYYFTSNTNYMLLLTDKTNSSCNEISITVSGYNGLNGENSSLSEIFLSSVCQKISVTIYNSQAVLSTSTVSNSILMSTSTSSISSPSNAGLIISIVGGAIVIVLTIGTLLMAILMLYKNKQATTIDDRSNRKAFDRTSEFDGRSPTTTGPTPQELEERYAKPSRQVKTNSNIVYADLSNTKDRKSNLLIKEQPTITPSSGPTNIKTSVTVIPHTNLTVEHKGEVIVEISFNHHEDDNNVDITKNVHDLPLIPPNHMSSPPVSESTPPND